MNLSDLSAEQVSKIIEFYDEIGVEDIVEEIAIDRTKIPQIAKPKITKKIVQKVAANNNYQQNIVQNTRIQNPRQNSHTYSGMSLDNAIKTLAQRNKE